MITSSLTADQQMKIKVILWNYCIIATDPEDLPIETLELFLKAIDEINNVIQNPQS